MKKLAVLLLLCVVCFPNCKKIKEKTNPEVWCIYTNVNGVRAKSSCESSEDAAAKAVMQLRDAGKNPESVKKSSCSDC